MSSVLNVFRLYAQRNPEWAGLALGHRTYNAKGQLITIGSDGCVITSLGMMLSMKPPEVNRRLLLANAFVGANVTIKKIDYASAFDGRLTYLGQSPWYDNEVPAQDMETLRNGIRLGNPSILCLDSRPDMTGVQYHYLLAVGVSTDGGIIVNDPWYNTTDLLTNINKVWYKRIFRGVYGKTDALAIYRIDSYRVEA